MNSMYFDEKQLQSGEMFNFIKALTDMCYNESDYYNDIHIKPADCGAFIVEWVQVPWDHEFGGNFQFVDEDECIMLERTLPDGTTQVFHSEDAYKEELEIWLHDNPGWVRTSYGTWTNEIENERFRKEYHLDE